MEIELGFEQYAVCDSMQDAWHYVAMAATDGSIVFIQDRTSNGKTEYVVYIKEPAINAIRRANQSPRKQG